jgi:pimeloyl-ACP methyl ester carboxylesterase
MVLACVAAGAQPAAAARFHRCRNEFGVDCMKLPVPLDRSGHVKGRVRLSVQRIRPYRRRRHGTVLALSGGPGQSALSSSSYFEEALSPLLAHRDLLVFDQRGTGHSGVVRCPALQGRQTRRNARSCARSLGRRWPFYRTLDSVADVEAVRRAAGVKRMIVYGVSYGTVVAQQYALLHPGHVESLVLDSPLPPGGTDAFSREQLGPSGRVYDSICEAGCPRVPGRPSAGLADVLARAPLEAPLVDGHGRRRTLALTPGRIADILYDQSTDRLVRLMLPGAVRSAQLGDLAPLARLWRRTQVHPSESARDYSAALAYATLCSDGNWPWDRTASPSKRLAQARAALASTPASAFGPFPRRTAMAPGMDIQICSQWPQTPKRPPVPKGPVKLRALVLSGDQDMVTPVENARAVKQAFPSARVVVVHHQGHAVLDIDENRCGDRALAAWARHHRVRRCRPRVPIHPRPPLPRSFARLKPAGLHGRRGRTLRAVADTLDDAYVEAAMSFNRRRAGGLRRGWMRLADTGIRLHRVALVPGVRVSGRYVTEEDEAHVTVAGSRAVRGRLVIRGRRVTGRLGRRRVHVRVARDRVLRREVY